MIEFQCTHCHTILRVPDEKAGQSGQCHRCGRMVVAPSASAAAKAAKGHAHLMEPAKAMHRADDEGEIPLAAEDDAPLANRGPEKPRPAAAQRERVVSEEIPLLEDEDEVKTKGAAEATEEAPAATAGGLLITPAGEVTVVGFQSDRILDAMAIGAIEQELSALVEKQGRKRIVLDFTGVKLLSSQMLGVLIAMQKKTTAAKGKLVLCAVREELKKVFQIVKMDRILPIVLDRESAVAMAGT